MQEGPAQGGDVPARYARQGQGPALHHGCLHAGDGHAELPKHCSNVWPWIHWFCPELQLPIPWLPSDGVWTGGSSGSGGSAWLREPMVLTGTLLCSPHTLSWVHSACLREGFPDYGFYPGPGPVTCGAPPAPLPTMAPWGPRLLRCCSTVSIMPPPPATPPSSTTCSTARTPLRAQAPTRPGPEPSLAPTVPGPWLTSMALRARTPAWATTLVLLAPSLALASATALLRVFQEARGRPGGVFNWLCEQVMPSNTKHYSINPQEKSGGGTM
eukprot:XP_014070461.1 PREDICTED: uncharacterized protein LOC106613081 isoform X6 [Salmo salar]